MSKTFRNQVFKRIIDLGKVTKAEVDDLVRIWRVGTGDEKAITLANFVKTVDEDLGSGGLTLTEIVTLIEEEIAELGGVYVPLTRQLTINGVTQDLSVNRTWTIPTHAPVTLATPSNGLTLVGQELGIGLASSGVTGALSGTKFDEFDAKIGGDIVFGQVAVGSGTNQILGSNKLWYNSASGRFGINTNNPFAYFHVSKIGITSVASGAGRGILISDDIYPRIVWENTTSISGRRVLDSFYVNNIFKYRLLSDTAGAVLLDNIFTFNTSNGRIGIGTDSPSDLIDVNGTARIRTINNLGTSATVVLTKSATGVISERTVGEILGDIGGVSGSLTSGRIPFATGSNTLSDDLGLQWDNSTKALKLNTASGTNFSIRNRGVDNVLTVNDGSDIAIITFRADRNVGIGVLEPSERLHVGGRLRIGTVDSGTGNNLVIDSNGVVKKGSAGTLKFFESYNIKTGLVVNDSIVNPTIGSKFFTKSDMIEGAIYRIEMAFALVNSGFSQTKDVTPTFTSAGLSGAILLGNCILDTSASSRILIEFDLEFKGATETAREISLVLFPDPDLAFSGTRVSNDRTINTNNDLTFDMIITDSTGIGDEMFIERMICRRLN